MTEYDAHRIIVILVSIYMALAVVSNAPLLARLHADVNLSEYFAFRVTTFLGFTPDEADELFRLQAGRAATGTTTPVDAVITFMEGIDERRNETESDMPPAQMWASAIGTLEGRQTSVETWASDGWATSPRVLAEAAIAVCDGRFSTPGVHTPEHVADIDKFLHSIARRAGMTDEPLVHHRTTTR